MISVSIQKDPSGKKKLQAVFSDGKKISFGSSTSTTFAEGADKKKRENYIKRHQVNEDWTKINAGSLSRYVLWEKPSIEQGIQEFKRRFYLK